MAESSLAADLLADFNESENDDDDFGIENRVSHSPETNGPHIKLRDFMELDDDEEADGDGDEDMGSMGLPAVHGGSELADDDDEEARKAKVEKMQLGNVDDVRSVAGLMKVLEPVLEVGFTEFRPLLFLTDGRLQNSGSNTTRLYPPQRGLGEGSKMTRSTNYWFNPTPMPYPSITRSFSYINSSAIIMLSDSPSWRTLLPIRWTMPRPSPPLGTTWTSSLSRLGAEIDCVLSSMALR